jgi:hypothetical protein
LNSIPLTVTIRATSLSLAKRQLRYSVKGTKAGFIKYGLDVQEEQLKAVPPMSVFKKEFGVESTGNEGVLTTIRNDGTFEERNVKTASGD